MEVWLCICKAQGGRFPHWMLTVTAVGASMGYRIHSVGGPSSGKAYSREITWKHLESPGVASRELLGVTDTINFKKLLAAAHPVPPQIPAKLLGVSLTRRNSSGHRALSRNRLRNLGPWLCFGCNAGFDTMEQAMRCECYHSHTRPHSVVLTPGKALTFSR